MRQSGDAAMTSNTTKVFLERLTEHCNAQQIPLPPLEYEDGGIVFSEALQDFIHAEGLCMRWLFGEKGEYDPQGAKLLAAVRKMDSETQECFLAGLKDYAANGGDIKQVFQSHGFNPDS